MPVLEQAASVPSAFKSMATLFNELPTGTESVSSKGKQRFMAMDDFVVVTYHFTQSGEPESFRTVVFCDGKAASFTVNHDGLTKISVGNNEVALKSIMDETNKYEIVYENRDSSIKSAQQQFKDTAKLMVGWVANIREQGRFSPPPVSLINKPLIFRYNKIA